MLPGRSVKLTLSREETQRYARRPRGKLYARVGAKKDGTICALHLKAYFDIGAYGDFHGGSNGFHCEGGLLSYKTPNARFEAFDVHTNHFRSECMRSVQLGFVAFAVESTVDTTGAAGGVGAARGGVLVRWAVAVSVSAAASSDPSVPLSGRAGFT